MTQDTRTQLFLPNKDIIDPDVPVNLRDNWRALENWSKVTWKKAVYQNSWTTAAGNKPAAFCIDGFGFVHFQGVVYGGMSGTTIFTIPKSLWPAATQAAMPTTVNIVGTGNLAGYIIVSTAGAVSLNWVGGGTVSFALLEGPSYSLDVAV
jgi:hypothetical protein